jgi:hypothetical protein
LFFSASCGANGVELQACKCAAGPVRGCGRQAGKRFGVWKGRSKVCVDLGIFSYWFPLLKRLVLGRIELSCRPASALWCHILASNDLEVYVMKEIRQVKDRKSG